MSSQQSSATLRPSGRDPRKLYKFVKISGPGESSNSSFESQRPPLAARMDDRQAAARAAAAGLNTPPLSGFHLDPDAPSCRQGLLLGYAALPEAVAEEKVRQLAAALSA